MKRKVAVIGAGPIGSLAAFICSDYFEVDLFDASFEKKDQSKDGRLVALGKAQFDWIKNLGINLNIKSSIDAVHVRDKLSSNTVTLSENPPQGYMIEYAEIADSVHKSFGEKSINKIEKKLDKEGILSLEQSLEYESIIVASGASYDADPIWASNAKEIALLFRIEHENLHYNTAIENFFGKEAIATLPYDNPHVSSCVWIIPIENEMDALNLEDDEFADALYQRFPHLGKFKVVSEVISHVLNRKIIWPPYEGKKLIIGDAAHKIHPIAGQGLNLGLRDLIELEKHVKKSGRLGISLSDFYDDYKVNRIWDLARMFALTEGSLKLFNYPLGFLRSIGMCALDNSSILKKILEKKASGF